MKLVTLVIMAVLMGTGMRYGQKYIMQAAGMPAGMPSVASGAETPKFSTDESDLMSTVFKSALRLFSGQASRNELAGELSDKLYSGRAGAGEMSELGIELTKPGGESPVSPGGPGAANLQPGATQPGTHPVAAGAPLAKQPTAPGGASAKPNAKPGAAAAQASPIQVRDDVLARFLKQAKPYTMELSLVPVAFLVLMLMQRIKNRRSRLDDLIPMVVDLQQPSDSEPYDMKHAVHSLTSEDFELLVALIYQRQGYRVSMSEGASGGRGGDFTLARKAERVLVQCKKLSQDHRVPVERVRELHDAMTTAGVPRGMYVAPCGYTWDARNFAKSKSITLINARTLDELITAAREQPEEDLLAVSQWAPKLMSKVQFTPPQCPACEATMEQLSMSAGTVWVCSQRPECRGRRSARRYQKPARAAAKPTDAPADDATRESTTPSAPTKPAASAPANPPPPQSTVRPGNGAAKPAVRPPGTPAKPAAAAPARPVPQPVPARPAAAAAKPSGPSPKTPAKPAIKTFSRPLPQMGANRPGTGGAKPSAPAPSAPAKPPSPASTSPLPPSAASRPATGAKPAARNVMPAKK